MKKILITGANGFTGSHLAEYILENRLGEVYGTIRANSSTSGISHLLDSMSLVKCDITDYFGARKTIKETMPTHIFHLAAQAYVPDSWKSPFETMQTNILGTLNILEAVREIDAGIKVHVASTSEIYGQVNENELPIKETNPLRPLSPYGVSKAASDLLAYQYSQSYGLKIVRTRAFNYTGRRSGIVFATSDWARQIVEIEKGLREPEIMVGRLDSRRDISDVRDVVRGYWLALEKGEPGEVYNICSGKTFSMKEVLDMMLGLSTVKAKMKIKVKTDPSRLRPSDIDVLYGDFTKFRARTGWEPRYSLKDTLSDLMEHWREKVPAEKQAGG